MDDDSTRQTVLFSDLPGKPVVAKFDQPHASSDGGAILLQACDRHVGVSEALIGGIDDRRQSGKIRHAIGELLRQRLYAIGCGYPDGNDASRLGSDPIQKLLCGRDPVRGEDLASQPTLSRFENATTKTEWHAVPWNKGKLLGQKPPLKLNEIWGIRIRLQLTHRARELALFNLTIDSKLRGCDLVALRVHDVVQGTRVAPRAIVMQRETQRPVQFELTDQTRDAVAMWITSAHLKPEQYLFPSRVSESPHLSTRQYSRIVGSWVRSIGLDPAAYGTHSLRRTKATLIYRRTRNLGAVQLLLGHTKLESTVRYLGIEVDDALEIAEQTEV